MEKNVSKRATLLSSPVLLIQTSNPKKNPSMAYTRYQCYMAPCKDGATPTVETLLKAGVRMDDIRHDSAHGFIAVGDKAIKSAKAAVEKAREARIAEARKLLAAVDAAAKVETPAE